jgi:tetratricopeptide (TPR) repeat protein
MIHHLFLRVSLRFLPLCTGIVLLASCSSAPTVPDWSGPEPEEVVNEIRAAGLPAAGELDVQPLRDPMVEDLRTQAVQFETGRRYADAATALDKALALAPDDPALLQERAEAAVLQKDLRKAEALARRAYDLGGKVGPLCRRHWATIRQSIAHRQRVLDVQGHSKFKGEKLAAWQQDSGRVANELNQAMIAQANCTLTGPPRY